MNTKNNLLYYLGVVLVIFISSSEGLQRCFHCRSRGELGSCKDPFTHNTTLVEMKREVGVEIVPCASGWCGKIVESESSAKEAAEDETVKNIYLKFVSMAHKSSIFYVSYGICGISLYFTTPFFLQHFNNNSNETINEHYFIFSSWFPFDRNQHYIIAYLIQLLGGFFGFCYICNAGTILFCMFIFTTAELRIIQHILKNFSTYSKKYEHQYNLPNKEAQRALIRNVIIEHKRIISFVGILNKSIRAYMIMDFVVSSLQLSFLALQIIDNKNPILLRCMVFSYFSTLTIQLFLTYWYAHSVTIESQNLAQAAFESEWTTYSLEVKKCFIMLIARAQKPLHFSIGPIYDMKVDALLLIFKTIYSYVAVIKQTNE